MNIANIEDDSQERCTLHVREISRRSSEVVFAMFGQRHSVGPLD
jgi:hypothetical protein